MLQIAVVGEGVIDRFVQGDTHKDVIGGSGLNTAVAARRAGANAYWYTRLASDPNGKALEDYAAAENVLASAVIRGAEPASLVKVHLKPDGQPSYEFELDGAVDWQWQESELENLKTFQILQIGSLSAVLEPGSSLLLQKLLELKNQPHPPLVTYDPNARPSVAKDEMDSERIRDRILRFVATSDLVKVSDEDLAWISPLSPNETAKNWSTLGPRLVIMTKGSEGASAFVAGEELLSVAGEKIEVVDTVGAGDTFMAWLLAQIANRYAGQIPTSKNEVISLLTTAAKAAAVTCSREGCKPPFSKEVI